MMQSSIIGCLVALWSIGSAGAATVHITILNYKFSPGIVNIHAGDEIVWTNKDTGAHTVTAQGGEFDSGGIDFQGTFKFVFRKAGDFKYACQLHPMMVGKIVVSAEPSVN